MAAKRVLVRRGLLDITPRLAAAVFARSPTP
jgi:hypothetical protein